MAMTVSLYTLVAVIIYLFWASSIEEYSIAQQITYSFLWGPLFIIGMLDILVEKITGESMIYREKRK